MKHRVLSHMPRDLHDSRVPRYLNGVQEADSADSGGNREILRCAPCVRNDAFSFRNNNGGVGGSIRHLTLAQPYSELVGMGFRVSGMVFRMLGTVVGQQ